MSEKTRPDTPQFHIAILYVAVVVLGTCTTWLMMDMYNPYDKVWQLESWRDHTNLNELGQSVWSTKKRLDKIESGLNEALADIEREHAPPKFESGGD